MRPGRGRNPGTPANTLAPRIWTRKPPRQCRPQLRPFNPDPDETVDLGQDLDGGGRPAVKPRRAKPPRTVKLLCLPPLGLGTLKIVEGKRSDLYYFRALPSDFGRAFEMTKVGGDTYGLHIARLPEP